MTKQVLVTGGAGFIGSHLVDHLLSTGHSVRVLDNLSTGRLENLQGKPVEFIEGDVASFATVCQAVQDCEIVFHLAALVSVPQSIADPLLNYHSNIAGTQYIFEAARLAGIKRIVFASSAAVYGNREDLPVRESDLPNPVSPYASAKYMAEVLATSYNNAYGMAIIGLRFMNVYGPRQNPDSPYSGVLSIFCTKLLASNPITIFGDGEQTRDFVYVDDVVSGLMQATHVTNTTQHVFNIGCGKEHSLNEIIQTLQKNFAVEAELNYVQEREGDIRRSYADTALARDVLGFVSQTSLSDGLEKTSHFYRL